MPQNPLTTAARAADKTMRRHVGGPFGAAIVRQGKVVAVASNTVLRDKIATHHAEINAIGRASKKLGRFSLDDCEIYSTTEPCPMCFAAIHWARLKKVVYCTTIGDVKRLGFNELSLSNQQMKRLGKSPVVLKRVKNASCIRLLNDWKRLAVKQTY